MLILGIVNIRNRKLFYHYYYYYFIIKLDFIEEFISIAEWFVVQEASNVNCNENRRKKQGKMRRKREKITLHNTVYDAQQCDNKMNMV